MYASAPNLVLGFHGCDKEVAQKIIAQNSNLRPSANNYDWLGHGVYFWENNPKRALDYAVFLKSNPGRSRSIIREPGVIGAVIDLGFCLNLLESKSLRIVKEAYNLMLEIHRQNHEPMPKNIPGNDGKELLLRKLDCAVIETIHTFNSTKNKRPYDSVRGVFIEGDKLYPGSGFNERNHIQICVRNPNCIKGYFHPRRRHPRYHVP